MDIHNKSARERIDLSCHLALQVLKAFPEIDGQRLIMDVRCDSPIALAAALLPWPAICLVHKEHHFSLYLFAMRGFILALF
ncbi:hypothetical protein CO676_02160 [Sinorhizobium sp. BJ1]|nr:hypothetical protein CO676_02160 [Sinorhizobium sp. BJ1]